MHLVAIRIIDANLLFLIGQKCRLAALEEISVCVVLWHYLNVLEVTGKLKALRDGHIAVRVDLAELDVGSRHANRAFRQVVRNVHEIAGLL